MPVRPLLVRPGARYRCFGDGLCCTSIHAIGPIGRAEVRRLQVLHPGLTEKNPVLDATVVSVADGVCTHLEDDGCRIHKMHGEAAKPSVCRRFPYRLVATPLGGRIATEHRCPCRTLGDRPPLSVDDALRSMGAAAGARLSADVTVSDRVAITRRSRVGFAKYVTLEAPILERLARGDDPLDALGAEPFPALDGATWSDVAHLYRAEIDGTYCGDALAWFGDVLLGLQGTRVRSLRDRPWAPAFDRAEARSAREGSPDEVLADWLADELWGLEWTERGTFESARRDLATRATIAREIVRRLVGIGVRPDRAAAEAVLICEMGGAAPLWRSVVGAFVS